MKPIKWTIEKVKELSALYKGPSEFKKANPSAYKAMRRYGLCEILYPLDQRERKPEFTPETLLDLMKTCKTRSEFQVTHPSAYNAARKLGIINQGFPTSNRYKLFGREPYTEEELIKAAKTYSTIKEWEEKDNGSYQVACRKGIVAKYGPKKMQGVSTAELELLAFLQSLCSDFKTKRFGNDYEIDCYSESLKLGVEYNGLYWHSEEQKERQYHLKKTKYFESLGIRIIHIWEHEWRDRKDQVKNFLASACKSNQLRVGARKCEFKEISAKEARAFLDATHIQGAPKDVALALGCFYQGLLVAVSTFGSHHRQGHEGYVLNRFACNPGYTVAGCLAKMSKLAFDRLGPLKSWADYSKSQANGYLKAGWEMAYTLRPDYFYCDAQAKVVGKQSRAKRAAGTPEGMTEAEHAKQDGLYRIWDCGKIALVYKKAA